MKGIWNKYKREFVVLIATLAMCVVFTVLNKNFLNYSNFLISFATDGIKWYTCSRYDVYNPYPEVSTFQ